MSIQTQISRIQQARDTLRNKAVELKISAGTELLDELAEDYNGIENNGSISAQVKEGETYTIPKGYHDGTGTVSGVAGGGNYNLQSKQVTPTKKPQQVTPDEGYYGLSDVSVDAIPAQYQDTSSVTATAGDVLAGKVIVISNGSVVPGEMVNNGAVSSTLTAESPTYTVPVGYHDGKGSVKIVPEEKTVAPKKSEQDVTPSEGKVLSKVTVSAIPAEYVDTSGATANASEILFGETAYSAGQKITGTMPNVGSVNKTLDTTTASVTIEQGYHDGTGTVNIVTENKSATPTKETQTVTPTTGKVLAKVTVAAIPAEYVDTRDANAANTDILAGKTAYVSGAKVTGTMANNGDVSKTIDGLSATSVIIPAGYTTGGTVSLTTDIEDALSEI